MSKLHELLAVDSSLKGQAGKTTADLKNTMEKKRHLFEQTLSTFYPDDVNKKSEIREQSEIQTTIVKEIEWLNNIVAKAIDIGYQIDHANTHAKANIVLEDGTVIAEKVPTTALLQLGHRIKEILDFIKQIPTLDPAKGYEPDTSLGDGTYKAREIVKIKTEKIEDYQVIVQATDKFPAQIVKVNKDIRIGEIREQAWSSLITPATKADLIARGEDLLRAVTKARSRANEQEIVVAEFKIGDKLLEYVFQPLNAKTNGRGGALTPKESAL